MVHHLKEAFHISWCIISCFERTVAIA